MSQRADETRAAGRGLISITGAKLWFIVTSYAVQLLLPRLLGSAESFGLYASAMSMVSILNNVLIAATVQSVSKMVSEAEDRAPAVLRQGLGLQLVVGGVLASSLFMLSGPLAGDVVLDPALAPLLRIASIVVLCYALYAALVGSLNGRRLFQKQAGLDATFSTLRTTGILVAAGLGFGAVGAISGFAAAAAVILLVAFFAVGPGRSGHAVAIERWLVFMAPLWLYQALLNGVLQIDIVVLKRTIAELAMAAGTAPVAAAELASTHAGYYRAAQTFAFVPYQLILSMTFIVFPTVSRATTTGDIEQTRATIRGAMRFSLLVLVAISAPIAGAADGIMRVAYPDEYLAGAPALGVLVFGMLAFALFVIAATVLSGAGRPGLAAAIAGVALALVVAGNRVLVMMVGLDGDTLGAAAIGTTIGTTVALVAVAAIVYRAFGAFLPLGSAIKTALAGAGAFAAAHFVPHQTALTALLSLASGFAAFVVILLVLREVRDADLQVVRRVLGRKRS